jgi:hypothetical protein
MPESDGKLADGLARQVDPDFQNTVDFRDTGRCSQSAILAEPASIRQTRFSPRRKSEVMRRLLLSSRSSDPCPVTPREQRCGGRSPPLPSGTLPPIAYRGFSASATMLGTGARRNCPGADLPTPGPVGMNRRWSLGVSSWYRGQKDVTAMTSDKAISSKATISQSLVLAVPAKATLRQVPAPLWIPYTTGNLFPGIGPAGPKGFRRAHQPEPPGRPR